MNFKQMKRRCPGSKFISVGILEGHRFVYDGYSTKRNGAVGNVIKSESEHVMGAVFEISPKDLESLDFHEGVPIHYQRTRMTINMKDGSSSEAEIYYREGEKEGKPSKEYRDIVIEGARECGIPEEYIEKYLDKESL